jgi:serine/threonine-protein kinase RsbW
MNDLVMDVMDTLFEKAFPGDVRDIAQVRRQVRDYLGHIPALDDVLLVVSELAANAVLHSRSRDGLFTVRVESLPGLVHVEVHDLGGPLVPDFVDDRHGLAIVDKLSASWGVADLPSGGRVVWARISDPR